MLFLFSIIVLSSCSMSVVRTETTTNCSSQATSMDYMSWIFSITNATVASNLNSAVLDNPIKFHQLSWKFKEALEYVYSDSLKYNTSSGAQYYKDFVAHYPILIRKLACGMLGPSGILKDIETVNKLDFYKLLVKGQDMSDWFWLNPSNLYVPFKWTKENRHTVYFRMVFLLLNTKPADPTFDTILCGFPDFLVTIFKDNVI